MMARMAKKKPETRAVPAGRSASDERLPLSAADWVTVWGEVTYEDATHLIIEVQAVDSPRDVGLTGAHTFKKIQLKGRGSLDNLDYFQVLFALADLKAKSQ